MTKPEIAELEARNAALVLEVEEARARRDEVGRQIAEARGFSGGPTVAPGAAHTGKMIVVAIAVLCGTGLAVLHVANGGDEFHRPPLYKHRFVTCQELAPLMAEARRATAQNFDRALAHRNLGALNGQTIDSRTVTAPAWVPFGYRGRPAIVGDYSDGILARDVRGGIWHVRREERAKSIGTFRIIGCQWGCGSPPNGMPPDEPYVPAMRPLWVLESHEEYRGELTIAYDAPTVDLEIEGGNCPLPP